MTSAPAKSGALKSARSLRSMRSTMGAKTLAFSSVNFSDGTGVKEGDKIFEEILPHICYKYNCTFPVVVKKAFRQDDYLKRLRASDKTKKIRKTVAMPFAPPSQEEPKSLADTGRSSHSLFDPNAKIVTAIYDNMNLKLCEVSLSLMDDVPRILIQTICLLAPVYDHLTKITLSKCHINAYVIHEMQKFLPQTHITEVCLDESPLPEGNFAILLDKGTKIKTLSLCRCKINDVVCTEIASKLRFSMEAEKFLLVLDLSSNHITNAGAKHLSEALRTNRHLRYLSLADNRIGDEGAIQIFNVLKEFPLTKQELATKRYRYTMYLKDRMEHYLKFLRHLIEEDAANKQKKPTGKKKYAPVATSSLKMSAEEMAGKALGPFSDPFAAQHVVTRDSAPHCRGNDVLCYLNLSYNELSYLSVKSLMAVITYQSLVLNFSNIGLIRVVIDGNNIPNTSSDLATISELINKNLSRFGTSASMTIRGRKSRASRMSLVPDDVPSLKAHYDQSEASRSTTGTASVMTNANKNIN